MMLYKDLQNLEDFETIQDDLNKLCHWTVSWLMTFNVNKCKLLHIGRNNTNYEYEMFDNHGKVHKLQEVKSEKDLGITVQNDLHFDQHINNTVNRANKLVGLIKRAFSFLNEETLLTLYKTLIRPILDYGNSIWSPTLKKDIRAVENVQRRVTKLLPELRHLSYKERLSKLHLTTLQYRRNRYDMIQMFKIVSNIDDVPTQGLFEFSNTQTRGHSKKLSKIRPLKTIRANSFFCRTINKWNALPEEIVVSKTVLNFKTQYDQHMNDQKYDTDVIY